MLHRASLQPNFEGWRTTARRLLAANVPPDEIVWMENAADALLPGIAESEAMDVERPAARVSKAFVDLAKLVACHRDSERWPLLYRVLWRLTHGEPHLLAVSVDDDVYQLLMMHKAVRRDRHKMTAFVRFRRVEEQGVERFVAWHRPDHLIVRLTAPFFRDRFRVMNWTILTPDESVHWDGNALCFTDGVPASAAPLGDELEELWKTYYSNIFNPARIKLSAMRAEMPMKHWATLPETQLIPDLIRDAPRRVEAMMKRKPMLDAPAGRLPYRTLAPARPSEECESGSSAAEFLPKMDLAKPSLALEQLVKASASCRGCSLYCHATQTVFGEGSPASQVVFVGEQPGDQEDRAGRPFVGPAGQLLDQLMQEAGVDRSLVYVTNAVKHFKFELRGERRIHAKPSAREVAACRPWVESELGVIKPNMLVCLGATAAQSLLGSGFRIMKQRGQVMESPWAPWTIATLHPSALLRIPDPDAKAEAVRNFVSDMKLVAKEMKRLSA